MATKEKQKTIKEKRKMAKRLGAGQFSFIIWKTLKVSSPLDINAKRDAITLPISSQKLYFLYFYYNSYRFNKSFVKLRFYLVVLSSASLSYIVDKNSKKDAQDDL